MRRSMLLVLIAVIALAVAVPATAASGAGAPPSAAVAQKAKGKAKQGKKKKTAKCQTARKKGKAKGKARRSLAAADSAAKRGKAKGGKKAKRKCGKPKPKAGPRRERARSPFEERLAERYRAKREEIEQRRQDRPKAPTLQDVAPLDGTYTSPSAPGLTVIVSGNGTQARVTYTLAKTAFSSEACQIRDVAIDVSGALSYSQSTGRALLSAIVSEPNGANSSANGYLSRDGSFQLGVGAMIEEPPGAGSFCSGNAQLTGTLVKQ